MGTALLRKEQDRFHCSDYHEFHPPRRREDSIPTTEECEALWARFGLSEDEMAHSRMVAEIARILAIYLKRAGMILDLELIVTCGYLHEITRGGDRALNILETLDEAGYSFISSVMASKKDIQPKKGPVDESDLVYLADSLLGSDPLVNVGGKNQLNDKTAGNSQALKWGLRKLRNVERINDRIERILGIRGEQIIERHKRGILAASLQGEREIYLVSHGVVSHEATRFHGDIAHIVPKGGFPLSHKGMLQARALQEKLRYKRISAIYSSDIRCSRETAEVMGKPHGLRPIEGEDLREAAFDKRGALGFGDISHYLQQYMEKGQDLAQFQPPNGESLQDCTFRVIPALYEILHSTRGNILIVGHPWLNRILLCQAMGRPLQDLFWIVQAYGCLNVIQYGNFTFDVKVLNETGMRDLAASA